MGCGDVPLQEQRDEKYVVQQESDGQPQEHHGDKNELPDGPNGNLNVNHVFLYFLLLG